MKQRLLSAEEVLTGYDAVSQLYPHIPPMLIWRAWEYAAYQHYKLSEPVLDVGCGDGRFFQLVWPQVQDVVGVDIDSGVADSARRSGAYREVYAAPAHQLPVAPKCFVSAFANCSLEHMDHLSEVLSSIHRSLHVGGYFLLSVVTDRLLEWTMLPLLLDQVEEPKRARDLRIEYEAYHHLVNPLSLEVWTEHLEEAGFEILEYIPIVPEMTSRLFLFLDQLWHVRQASGELGDLLYSYLKELPSFLKAFRQILAGVLQMERDWSSGSGIVLWTRRQG